MQLYLCAAAASICSFSIIGIVRSALDRNSDATVGWATATLSSAALFVMGLPS